MPLLASMPSRPTTDDETAQAFLAGLNLAGQATVLLDASQNVIAMTECADQYMGGAIFIRGGKLAAAAAANDLRLQGLISSFVRPRQRSEPASGVIMLPTKDGVPLLVRGAAIPASLPIQHATAILTFASIGHANLPGVSMVREALGLTLCEAETALALAMGATTEYAAKSRGVSIETVRSQLKSIFQKTGARRQATLAVMIMKLQMMS